jgi:hypothetical protein
MAWHGMNMERYKKLVPIHVPCIMRLWVIGEVLFTPSCLEDLARHFDSFKGSTFEWPKGAESIPLCPGTGKIVKPDYTTPHILVACKMCGSNISGTALNLMTRIIPRILTMEGYNKLLPTERSRQIKGIFGKAPPSAEEMRGGGTYQDFYPFLMNVFCGTNLGVPVTMGPGFKLDERLMPAYLAWGLFEKSGLMKEIDAWENDEMTKGMGQVKFR